MNDIKEKPNRIAELRHKFGISQEQLAEKLNVTQASVSLYENGGNVPTDVLIVLSRYFNVTLEYLLNITDDERATPIRDLSDAEYNILRVYRGLSPSCRRIIDTVVNSIIENIPETDCT